MRCLNMITGKEIYNYLEDEGFSPDNYRVVKDALSSIEYESFKLNDFNINYEDRILHITTCFCEFFGKESPEVNKKEFYKMTSMMASHHKIGRITFNHQPLHITLDWSIYILNKNDFKKVMLLFLHLIEVKETWSQTVFDVIFNNASFEDLYMEMEI